MPTQHILEPCTLSTSVFTGNNDYRITAELIKWAHSHASNVEEGAFKDLGIDCAHIVQRMNNVKSFSLYSSVIKQPKVSHLIDYIIFVYPYCTRTCQVRLEDDTLTCYNRNEPYLDTPDRILICRVHESHIGHGLRWFNISLKGYEQLIKAYPIDTYK